MQYLHIDILLHSSKDIKDIALCTYLTNAQVISFFMPKNKSTEYLRWENKTNRLILHATSISKAK